MSQPIRIVHTSDVHLGRFFNFTRFSQGLQRARDLKFAFSKVVDFAIKNKADLFLLGGDIFDRVNPTNETRVFFIREMKRLYDAKIQCFAIAGNHDIPKSQLRDETALGEVSAAGFCHVFDNREKIESLKTNIRGTEITIHGKSYDPMNEFSSPLVNTNLKLDKGKHILLLHGAYVKGKPRPLNELPYQMQQHPIFESLLPKNLTYLALGHIHTPIIIQASNGAVVGVPGGLEILEKDESGKEKGFIFAEIGDSCKARFVAIEIRPTKLLQFEIKPEIKDVTNEITLFLEKNRNPKAIAWINLTGTITEEQYTNLDMRKLILAADACFFAYAFDRTQMEHARYGKIFAKYQIISPFQAVVDYVEKKMNNVSPETKLMYEKVLTKARTYLGESK
ncbi:MAG TPA: exonuclease SbcCD subunit D [archaeon]|nr:exonuclease SbcCD subunit D [archaeon]